MRKSQYKGNGSQDGWGKPESPGRCLSVNIE